MPSSPDAARPISSHPPDGPVNAAEESSAVAPWLAIVADKVKTMRYGVIQIVVHDSKVVQIERTERTCFDVPQVTGSR